MRPSSTRSFLFCTLTQAELLKWGTSFSVVQFLHETGPVLESLFKLVWPGHPNFLEYSF